MLSDESHPQECHPRPSNSTKAITWRKDYNIETLTITVAGEYLSSFNHSRTVTCDKYYAVLCSGTPACD
jgi:hypothetical protein